MTVPRLPTPLPGPRPQHPRTAALHKKSLASYLQALMDWFSCYIGWVAAPRAQPRCWKLEEMRPSPCECGEGTG